MALETNEYYIAIQRLFGKCAASTDISDLKAITKSAEDKITMALISGIFDNHNTITNNDLVEAKKAIGTIGKTLGTVQDICSDVVAVNKIYYGIKTLSADNSAIIYNDSQKAAEAFDMLFQGFGRLCRHLPEPAKSLGKFLEEFSLIGDVNKYIYTPYFDRLHKAHLHD